MYKKTTTTTIAAITEKKNVVGLASLHTKETDVVIIYNVLIAI